MSVKPTTEWAETTGNIFNILTINKTKKICEYSFRRHLLIQVMHMHYVNKKNIYEHERKRRRNHCHRLFIRT